MGGSDVDGGNVDGGNETMARIVAAIEQGRAGDAAGARAELGLLWDGIGPGGDPLHRCTLAHFLADLQDEDRDELVWDERALDAAGVLTDQRAQEYDSTMQVRALLPSLHLSLADDHRRLGATDRAREHLVAARDALPDLPDDGYGALVRSAFDQIAAALDAGSAAPLPESPSAAHR